MRQLNWNTPVLTLTFFLSVNFAEISAISKTQLLSLLALKKAFYKKHTYISVYELFDQPYKELIFELG